MYRRTLSHIVVVLAAMFVACGCSVKEDRMECPVFLTFNRDVNHYGSTGGVVVHVFEQGSGAPTITRTDRMEDFTSEDYYIPIQKGPAFVTVLAGAAGAKMSDNRVVFPSEWPVDEVYALKEEFTTEPLQEEYCVKDTLRRQVTPLDVNLTCEDGGPYPFTMVLRSRWIGFDETTLEPLKGEYFSILAPDSVPGHYSANIPRQNDTSLALEFWTADPKKGGRMLTSYRLGEFMTRAGYDWKMPHLHPFHFELNYANARLTIQVNDWREQIAIDIKI